jgi:hypothetical protein
MSSEKRVFSLVDFRREETGASLVGMDPHHKPTVRGSNFRVPGIGRKPQDLVGLLICHGARARRASLPLCSIRLEVFTPTGKPAVEISFD